MNEFYSNIYDPEDDVSKQCRVRGQTNKFDAQTLSDFLGTRAIVPKGEQLNARAIAAK